MASDGVTQGYLLVCPATLVAWDVCDATVAAHGRSDVLKEEGKHMVRCWRLLSTAFVLAGSGCMESPKAPTARTNVVADGGHARQDSSQVLEDGTERAKEDAERRLKGQLADVDTEVAKLHEKGLALKEEAKTRWNKKMAELKQKQKVVRDKVDELGASAGDAWKHIEKGAQAAWEDLRKAIAEAAEEF